MFRKLKIKYNRIFDKSFFPITFSFLGLLSGFLFLGKISNINDSYLGIFSFIHSGALIFSHLLRFGSDFDVLKSKEKLNERFKDSDFLIKYIFQTCSILILGLIFIKDIIPNNLFWGLLTACLLSINIVFSNYIRSKNYINLFSIFLHSPFIISAFLIFLLSEIQQFTGIKIFVFSLSLLVLIQLFFLKFHIKVDFFKIVNLDKIKIFYTNLFPIFISGLIILVAAQLPIIIFGILENYEDAAIFKILNKICSLMLIISRAFFASTIPRISGILNKKREVEKIYNQRNLIVFLINLVVSIIIIMLSSYIKYYFNIDFSYKSLILLLFAFNVISICGPINELYVITGHEIQMGKIFTFSFLISLPFFYYLTLNFMIIGSIFSVLIFNSISSILLMINYYKKIGIQLFLPLHFLNND